MATENFGRTRRTSCYKGAHLVGQNGNPGLKVSPETVVRDWKLAKSWLAREMGKAAAAKDDA